MVCARVAEALEARNPRAMALRRSLAIATWLALCTASCTQPTDGRPLGVITSALTAAERMVRLTQIRDAAAEVGLANGVLLAGIANAETGLAHCWSEATWACQGPASEDCDFGPVIAGSGDGPCENMQGGLGMFQFDAGTYEQTLAREGDRILSIAGNVQAGIDFVVAMVIRSTYIEGVDTREQAIAWMNSVVVDGAGHTEWIQTVTRYYNGCVPGTCSVYDQRFASYDRALRQVWNEMGAEFWAGAEVPECEPVPPSGRVIDDTDRCTYLGGNPTYWRSVTDAGYGGSLRWTNATDYDVPSNYVTWQLVFERSGEYELFVPLDPDYAESRQAPYTVGSAAEADEWISVDQTIESIQSLGVFRFEADTEYAVRLDDNSGEPNDDMIAIVVDAIELHPIETREEDAGVVDEDGGGLSTRDGGAERDAGRRPAPSAPGCGCAMHDASRSPAMVLGLAILVPTVLGRRRRAIAR